MPAPPPESDPATISTRGTPPAAGPAAGGGSSTAAICSQLCASYRTLGGRPVGVASATEAAASGATAHPCAAAAARSAASPPMTMGSAARSIAGRSLTLSPT